MNILHKMNIPQRMLAATGDASLEPNDSHGSILKWRG
jgi:hypothetical protein